MAVQIGGRADERAAAEYIARFCGFHLVRVEINPVRPEVLGRNGIPVQKNGEVNRLCGLDDPGSTIERRVKNERRRPEPGNKLRQILSPLPLQGGRNTAN